MKITRFAVDRPVTTTMLFLGLVFFGILSYKKLAVNLMPDLKLPYVIVNTVNIGATPEEIESEITDKIEKEVISINNLKEIKSYSMDNISMLTIQFNMSKDPDKALTEVKEKLDLVIPDLPREAEKPLVYSYNPNETPILNLIVSGEKSAKELFDYTDKILKNRLLKINGVSKADLSGGEVREIKVLADTRRMYEVQMNITDVASTLKAINAKMSAGDFSNKHIQFAAETNNKFRSVNDVRNSYITAPSGPTKLTDFALVVDSVKRVKTKSSFFDIPNNKRYKNIVNIGIMKKSSANAVLVAEEVKKFVEEISDELPEGIKISIPYDSSKYVKSSVDDALMNVILGILLTGLILVFFVGDIRTSIIVSISIPISLISTFIIMKAINASLNMLTLMSFSVAIGALISNSIVVIENIMRLKKTGMTIKEAAINGTQEVTMSVIASTGTNLVVFLPIASMSSIAGAFFKEYALTITAATVFSLIVSFMLTPMLTTVVFRKDKEPGRFARFMDRLFGKLEDRYERSLARLIAKVWRPIVLFIAMFGVFILSTGLLSSIGFEFEPQEDNGNIYIGFECVAGTSINENARIISLVNEKISKHKEVKAIISNVGIKNEFTKGSNVAKITVTLVGKDKREISNADLAEIIYDEINEIPEIIPFVSTKDSDDGAPLSFTLQSDNMQKLIEANNIVDSIMRSVPGLLNYESNFRQGNKIIDIKPKQRLLAELGISPVELAMAIRGNINGIKAGVYKDNGKEYDIMVSYPENQINSIEKIKQIPFFVNGKTYTVEQLGDLSYKNSQAQILHVDKEKTVEFSVIPNKDVVANVAQDNIKEALATVELDSSIRFNWSGNIKELDNTVTDMIVTFLIAMMLMYMLLASLLENFWHPVIIFTTVPMAMIGVFLFMYLGGTTMNIMSLMAIITLLGLVVNDSILIHDYTEQLKNRGIKLKEATLTAGKTKMKTVIMTTIAIIAGMLPNALGIGDAGAEYRTPMAVVTIGGIITSTILTLYVIPSLFYIIKRRKVKNQ
jgi:HAE1 family hydrophobic/amphiphilic exporter-1